MRPPVFTFTGPPGLENGSIPIVGSGEIAQGLVTQRYVVGHLAGSTPVGREREHVGLGSLAQEILSNRMVVGGTLLREVAGELALFVLRKAFVEQRGGGAHRPNELVVLIRSIRDRYNRPQKVVSPILKRKHTQGFEKRPGCVFEQPLSCVGLAFRRFSVSVVPNRLPGNSLLFAVVAKRF